MTHSPPSAACPPLKRRRAARLDGLLLTGLEGLGTGLTGWDETGKTGKRRTKGVEKEKERSGNIRKDFERVGKERERE